VDTSGYIDIFSTKGMEYIFILGFIVILVFFWRFLIRLEKAHHPESSVGSTSSQTSLPQNLYYHQGHIWVEPEQSNVAKIGMDSFALKLLSRARFADLPRVGSYLEQGEKGWKMSWNSTTINVLSPVDGEVLEVNQEVLDNPWLVDRAPYGEGWLLKVRVPKMKSNLAHLLSGKLATTWMEETTKDFYSKAAFNNNVSSKNTGSYKNNGASTKQLSIKEIAEALPEEKWKELAQEFLLTT
jgi:glycine cleavage system H protein